MDGLSTKANTSNMSHGQQIVEFKPRKNLSSFMFFSQEFKEILRQRFPFLTANQVIKAVNHKWQSLP